MCNLPKSLREGGGGICCLKQVFSEHTEISLPEEARKFMLLFSGSYLASVDYEAMRDMCTA